MTESQTTFATLGSRKKAATALSFSCSISVDILFNLSKNVVSYFMASMDTHHCKTHGEKLIALANMLLSTTWLKSPVVYSPD